MDITKLHYPLDDDCQFKDKTVIAMGFFDGFHKGHQAVLQRAKEEAQKHGTKLVVLTYDHHPALVYKKMSSHEKRYITLLDYKLKLFKEFGVDEVLLVNYSYQFQSQSPQEFIQHFLSRFNPIAVVAGFDHTYGGEPADNMVNLPKYVNGAFKVITVPALKQNDQKVSSTQIRNNLDNGHIEKVNQFNLFMTTTLSIQTGPKLNRPLVVGKHAQMFIILRCIQQRMKRLDFCQRVF